MQIRLKEDKTALTHCNMMFLIYIIASSEQMCNTKKRSNLNTLSPSLLLP